MDSIKKYKSFKLSLLSNTQVNSLSEDIDAALELLKEVNFRHYRRASHFSAKSAKSKVDHYLAIDDFVYNSEDNRLIGVDWTININSIDNKIEKHEMLSEVQSLLVDYTCVVCIVNEDILGDLDASDLARAMYKIIKLIDNEVIKPGYAGYLIIDAKDI